MDVIKEHTAAVSITCIIGYTLCGISHSFGLYLLYRVRALPINQKYLLVNLSSMEMILSWVYVVFWIFAAIDTKYLFAIYFNVPLSFFMACVRIGFLHIILDRFLEIYLSIKYPLYMKSKRLIYVMVSGWVLMFILVIGIHSIDGFEEFSTSRTRQRVMTICVIVMDISIVISSIVTYIYFYSRVRKIHIQEHGMNTGTGQRVILIGKFKVPFLMVLTFILFNISGTSVVVSVWYKLHIITYILSAVLMIAGFLSDAFIYVYLQKDVWKTFLAMIGKSNQENTTTVN